MIGLIIFVLIIVFNAIKAMVEARFAEAEKQKERQTPEDSFDSDSKNAPPPIRQPVRQRERPNRKPLSGTETETRKPRSSLSRELAEQGAGARFEADPGTLDTSHLEGPSLESTVKPTLESMTGIYEAAPNSTELGDQPLTIDIQKLITRPEGIRQAVILAEILKRPEL